MEILGYRFQLNKVKNIDKTKPRGSGIVSRITQTQLTRSRQDIKKWRDSLLEAENKIRPRRISLYRIFQDVILDPHLSSVRQQRANKVLSRGFNVVNSNGEIDQEKTDLLKTKWFNDFLRLSLESIDYGFSLIEFGDITNDEFVKVIVVPREYVIPERGVFTTRLSGANEIHYDKPPIDRWSLFVGSETDFGLLNKATPIVLWKRLVQATWAEYNELYGIPLRIAKTSTKDSKARNNLEDMMRNLGSSAWAVFDEDDDIEIIQAIKAGSHLTFKDFIKLCDEQLSKLYLGQTMTTDEGSSKSQAEVHAQTMESFTGQDLRWISYVINKQLFPFLTMKMLNFDGLTFQWDLSESLTLTEQFAIDQILLEHYEIPTDYIETTYGTPVEQKEVQALPVNGITVMNDVSKLYEGFFKHGEGCQCGNC